MTLAEVRRRGDQLGQANRSQTGLASIYGGGEARQPDWALVFINPTQRNLSSRAGWSGPRFPFVGTRRIWQFLADCGLLDSGLVDKLPASPSGWSVETAIELETELSRARLYITNVVKETGVDSCLPSQRTVARYQDLLHDEIGLIRPRRIIAFGGLTYRTLTGQAIRLMDAYQALIPGSAPTIADCQGYPVWPCYFPVGRGNPRRARAMLRCYRAWG